MKESIQLINSFCFYTVRLVTSFADFTVGAVDRVGADIGVPGTSFTDIKFVLLGVLLLKDSVNSKCLFLSQQTILVSYSSSNRAAIFVTSGL